MTHTLTGKIMPDIEIKENSKETLCFVKPLTEKGKKFLDDRQKIFQGMYRWAHADNLGYLAEEQGLSVKWWASLNGGAVS